MSAESQDALIAFQQVTKTYGEGVAAFQALRGVDLAIREGEFVAIMGPSGSGKSTALNVLGCLDAPTTGAYVFRNVRVDQLTRNQRALLRRHYLGFVFQGFNLLARTSAQENVELPLLYRGEDAKHRHAASREALAMVGLTGWEHHTPAELSGGQQQRVAIARAIVTRPLVLLAGAGPSLTVARAAKALGLSRQATTRLIAEACKAHLLREITQGNAFRRYVIAA